MSRPISDMVELYKSGLISLGIDSKGHSILLRWDYRELHSIHHSHSKYVCYIQPSFC